MCASTDGTWGNSNDALLILRYSAGPPVSATVTSVLIPGGAPVGFLDPINSIPVRLDDDTFALYTAGRVVWVTNVRTSPTYNAMPVAGLQAAPLGRVNATTVAYQIVPGAMPHRLAIHEVTTGLITFVSDLAPFDGTQGSGNISIPLSPDVVSVFVVSVGADNAIGSGDDILWRYRISDATSTNCGLIPFGFGRPIALSASLVAVPGGGPDTVTGGGLDDVLIVFSDNGGFTTSSPALGGNVDIASITPFTRIGAGGVTVAVQHPAGNSVVAFTDPAAGTKAALPITGTPVLTRLETTGDLAVFGPGGNLIPGDGDDVALVVDAAATGSTPFAPLLSWTQGVPALSDGRRIFAASATTGLLVFQTRAVGAPRSASALPLATIPAPLFPFGIQPFVPIGDGLGVMQSPGPDGTLGTVDDQILFARY
jgi:hypothetical protein